MAHSTLVGTPGNLTQIVWFTGSKFPGSLSYGKPDVLAFLGFFFFLFHTYQETGAFELFPAATDALIYRPLIKEKTVEKK